MVMAATAIAITAIIVFVVFKMYFNNNKQCKPNKIFSVYSLPGKWYCLKYLFMLFILTIKKFKPKLMKKYLYTQHQKQSAINNLEQAQILSCHDKGFDAVFFHGVSMENYYFCGGNERRHDGKSFGLLYLVIPDIGLLGNEKLPNTLLETDSTNPFSAEEICFTPIKPMKQWKISFNGKMRSEENPLKLFNVEMEATWSSDFQHFFYEEDINIKALSKAMATEEWSNDYFKTFKESHQTHYEQMGHITGIIKVNNKLHELNMMAFRDHSFGYKRDWSLLHRYAFHFLYMSDDSRIAIGVINNPSTMSQLKVGYIIHSDKTINTIESCDLELYQHAENGNPGKNIAFTFCAGGKDYTVTVTVQYESVHYKGYEKEARLIERFLTCDVNGVKGRGIAEWHYNNVKGK